MVETLRPQRRDKDHVMDAIRDDERFLEPLLEDDRRFERLMAEEEIPVPSRPSTSIP